MHHLVDFTEVEFGSLFMRNAVILLHMNHDNAAYLDLVFICQPSRFKETNITNGLEFLCSMLEVTQVNAFGWNFTRIETGEFDFMCVCNLVVFCFNGKDSLDRIVSLVHKTNSHYRCNSSDGLVKNLIGRKDCYDLIGVHSSTLIVKEIRREMHKRIKA